MKSELINTPPPELKKLNPTLLSIGIPVYNEELFLKSTLESILINTRKINWNCELIIVDNASNDSSAIIITNFLKRIDKEKNLTVKFIQNDMNEGFNSSCDKIIDLSLGKYLWILGAQELLLPHCLVHLSAYLNSHIDHLLVNSEVWNQSRSKLLDSNYFKFSKDIVWDSRESFFESINGPHPCISYNVSLAVNLKNVLDKSVLSHFWGMFERHLDAIVNAETHSFRLIAKPVITEISDENHWSRGTIDFFGSQIIEDPNIGFNSTLAFNEVLVQKYRKYSYIFTNIGFGKKPISLVKFIIGAKSNGKHPGFNTILRTHRVFRYTLWWWVFGLPIILLPQRIVRFLSLGINSFRLNRNKFSASDVRQVK